LLPGAFALALGACASLDQGDPVQVTVAGVESLPGEGFEMRMMVKLRVQNPNDTPLEYDGIYLRLDVQEKPFATGVSDQRGSVPRFGESVVGVPVTVSMLNVARQAFGMLEGKALETIRYEMNGKFSGPALRTVRFQSQGELALPNPKSARTAPRTGESVSGR
jgi:LEA14-like dessication related protein